MESRLLRLIEPTTQLDSRRKIFSNASLMRMVVPLFFEQLLTMMVGIADTFMIRYAGDAAVSGVSLTPLVMLASPLSNEIIYLVILLVFIHNLFNAAAFPASGALPNGLRAAGDVRYTMVVAVASTIIIRFVLSVILGIWMDLGVIGVAAAMFCDWMVRAV